MAYNDDPTGDFELNSENRGSVRERGGNLRRTGAVTGVAIDYVGLLELQVQPRTKEAGSVA